METIGIYIMNLKAVGKHIFLAKMIFFCSLIIIKLFLNIPNHLAGMCMDIVLYFFVLCNNSVFLYNIDVQILINM